MTGKFVAYYRVSTKRQGRSGLGLEAQRHAVCEYLNGGKWTLVAEVTEVETGTTKRKRPELQKALALCRVHNATLLVAKLDRLSRNVNFITSLQNGGVKFVACDMPDVNEMTVQIVAVMAEAEAKAISERTKKALAAAKARGVMLGGNRGGLTPSVTALARKNSIESRIAQASKRAADLLPVIEAIKAEGATTLRQIAEVLNERQIPTARGGAWSAVQVQRVLNVSVTN